MSESLGRRLSAPIRAVARKVLVPELREGLRAQFQFRVNKAGAEDAKLARPLMTGDESVLNDAWVHYLNLLARVLDEHAPERIGAILEWGLGHSTSYLYELAQARGTELFVSIEHNERYQKAFARKFPPADFFESRVVSRVGYSPPQARDSGENYASCALAYGRTFDLIFVDGRRRNECLLVASRIVSDTGIVILHDCQRTRYDVGCGLFDVVAEYDGTGGFRVMLKKQS